MSFNFGDSKNKINTKVDTTGTTNQTTSSTSQPTVPGDWTDLFKYFQNAANASGNNPAQAAGQGYFQDQVNSGGVTPQIQNLINNFQSEFAAQPTFNLGNTYGSIPGFSAPTVTAPNASASTATGATASSFANPYLSLFGSNVASPALQDLYHTADIQGNQLRGRYAAEGAFGGSRQGVAEGELASDTARAAGTLSEQLRQAELTTALGAGSSDAAAASTAALQNSQLATGTSQFNAGNQFAASGQNAGNTIDVQKFIDSLTNNRQQFDVNTGVTQSQDRQKAVSDMISSLLGINSVNSGNASSLFDTGSGGAANILNLLRLGISTFGNNSGGQSSGSASQSTSTSGTSSGSTFGGGFDLSKLIQPIKLPGT